LKRAFFESIKQFKTLVTMKTFAIIYSIFAGAAGIQVSTKKGADLESHFAIGVGIRESTKQGQRLANDLPDGERLFIDSPIGAGVDENGFQSDLDDWEMAAGFGPGTQASPKQDFDWEMEWGASDACNEAKRNWDSCCKEFINYWCPDEPDDASCHSSAVRHCTHHSSMCLMQLECPSQ
jgi:hypothetical protein